MDHAGYRNAHQSSNVSWNVIGLSRRVMSCHRTSYGAFKSREQYWTKCKKLLFKENKHVLLLIESLEESCPLWLSLKFRKKKVKTFKSRNILYLNSIRGKTLKFIWVKKNFFILPPKENLTLSIIKNCFFFFIFLFLSLIMSKSKLNAYLTGWEIKLFV